MLRRLHHEQPESFAFTPANQAWAEAQIAKYPEGRQQSAVIPLLWRGQEQEGWVTRPMIEHIANMLGMAEIRVLEVATFYFMFQLQPVGSVAHVQVCGTTSCMICGAEDLIGVCKRKIAAEPHKISADGKLSWEEVECLGACANAPMAQIGKDYYEDLTAENFEILLDRLAAGEVPRPGPQNGRWASEPIGGLTSLEGDADEQANASVYLATELGDTVKRIDGSERTATDLNGARGPAEPRRQPEPEPTPAGSAEAESGEETERRVEEAKATPDVDTVAPEKESDGVPDEQVEPEPQPLDERAPEPEPAPEPESEPEPELTAAGDPAKQDHGAIPDYDGDGVAEGTDEGTKPELLAQAREGGADNLKEIKGIGPKLEDMLNEMGVFHFDQIASWNDDEVAWVNANLSGFKGRVTRDEWVAQAKILATGGETEFSKRVEAGEVESSKDEGDA